MSPHIESEHYCILLTEFLTHILLPACYSNKT